MRWCFKHLELKLCLMSCWFSVPRLQVIIPYANWFLIYFSLPLAKPHEGCQQGRPDENVWSAEIDLPGTKRDRKGEMVLGRKCGGASTLPPPPPPISAFLLSFLSLHSFPTCFISHF